MTSGGGLIAGPRLRCGAVTVSSGVMIPDRLDVRLSVPLRRALRSRAFT